MQGGEERCLAGGMDGYVAKPIKLEYIFSVNENVIPGMNQTLSSRRNELNITETEVTIFVNGNLTMNISVFFPPKRGSGRN